MLKGRELRAAFVVAALILLSLALASSVSAGGGRPSWQVGDYWEYEGWENTPVPGAYRHRVDVEAIERRTAGGSGYTAYRLKDAWTFPSGGFIPLRMWQTTDALATVEIQDSLPIMFLGLCVAGSLGPCSSSYSPPATVYGFPLAPGKEWTAASTRTLLTDSGPQTDEVTLTMRVLSERDLTVTLNESGQPVSRTFHTFEIGLTSLRMNDTVIPYSPAAFVLDYSDEVGLWVHVARLYGGAGEYNLTGFQYTRPPPVSLWPFVGLIALVAGSATAVFVLFRRRRRRGPTGPESP